MGELYDFTGWATRNNLRCTDGRVIMKDAFKDNNGQRVPLVWNHQHNDPNNILGHADLENREEGVYAYCKFNDTVNGQNAKMIVEHGDVTALSIFANGLKQQGSNVLHGAIREVSLVLAGANPGAFIESVIRHGEMSDEEAVIYTGEQISLCHADDQQEAESEEKAAEKDEGASMAHADESTEEAASEEETVADVFDTLTDKQKNVVYALI